jgi:hypothetical protein
MKKTIFIGLMAGVIWAAGSLIVANAQNTASSQATTWNSACIISAVEKRETAIINAHDSLSTAIKTSLEKRKTALVAAWGKTASKERRQARLAAWNAFRSGQKTARQAHLSAVKSAWKQFKTDARACKIDVTGVEPEGLDVSVSAAAATSANTQ